MQLVQVTLTPDLAGLLAASADITIKAHEADQIVTLTDDELLEYKRLAVFMAAVASDPSAFPVKGSLAKSLKKKVRAAKGPAQPRSRRKVRSQGQQKRDRAARREAAVEYNAALEKVQAEQAEREEFLARRRAEIETEPKFDVVDIAGNVIIEGVPQSMVRPHETEALPEAVTTSEFERVLQLPPGVRV